MALGNDEAELRPSPPFLVGNIHVERRSIGLPGRDGIGAIAPITDPHMGALGYQSLDHSQPDPGRATGDERHLALEPLQRILGIWHKFTVLPDPKGLLVPRMFLCEAMSYNSFGACVEELTRRM